MDASLEAAWARVQLAVTLILQGQAPQALAALELARQAFEAQGNLVGQARTDLLQGQIAAGRWSGRSSPGPWQAGLPASSKAPRPPPG